MKLVGLMSGTSLDGIDAALVELGDEAPSSVAWELAGFVTRPYTPEQRERLRSAAEDRASTADLCRLHVDLGGWLADAADAVCQEAGAAPSEVAVVGSHGHTVWHEPPTEGRRGASLQIGSAAVVAERTGLPVVADFRARDLAAGGHGAPLVPFADRLLFSAEGRRRALQNVGGMANVTLLPPRGSGEALLAFDTGPGVALLDAAAEMATGGEQRFDADGRLAAEGSVDAALLDRLLDIPFLDEPPPRSTGRELFGTDRVRELVEERGLEPGRPGEGWPDLLATLTAFTARTVGDAYRRWVMPRGVDEVFLTGGGARNPVLVDALRAELEPLPLRPAEELGLDPDAREAVAFAVLSWAHLRRRPGNVPEATGARGGRVLGSYTPGRKVRRPPDGSGEAGSTAGPRPPGSSLTGPSAGRKPSDGSAAGAGSAR